MTGDARAADDLLQEAYYRFLRARVVHESDAHRRNYLFRIATNLARDERRRPPIRQVPEDQGAERPAAGAQDPQSQAAARMDLSRAMARLKPRERSLLWLAMRARVLASRNRGSAGTEDRQRQAAALPGPAATRRISERRSAMTSCHREADLLEVIADRGAAWRNAANPDLVMHVGSCALCRDLADVAGALHEDQARLIQGASVPSAGLVWWRANIRGMPGRSADRRASADPGSRGGGGGGCRRRRRDRGWRLAPDAGVAGADARAVRGRRGSGVAAAARHCVGAGLTWTDARVQGVQ